MTKNMSFLYYIATYTMYANMFDYQYTVKVKLSHYMKTWHKVRNLLSFLTEVCKKSLVERY